MKALFIAAFTALSLLTAGAAYACDCQPCTCQTQCGCSACAL